ncbi:SGNH/GDSL hydrolase family protein [Streptomyces glomeratus]|uniref:SGNH hydrolase-type esterase domain-containing protein n=1 Tax=Streptomyces glomeratus TaxID=284452 RepID=A0ABP6LHC6_9ACTN|nr:SGNH/GDSL hydrolase family protein [Streptomyces glomeratus]MCF1509352.1 SGNH/GDSL hydrolase family protein [Streptomyces glomeratus]
MRKPWIVGTLMAGLLLGGCGDPSSGPQQAPPAPTAPAAPATAHQRAAATTDPAPTRTLSVLYLGDSIAMENQKVLGQQLESVVHARYTSAPYSGTTLCDYLEGGRQRSLVPPADKAAALVRAVHPDFVVLQFWGNSWGYTPCMDGITYDSARSGYFARYTEDAARLTEQIAAAGGTRRPRIVWVLQGPDPVTPDRVRRVNETYLRQARASGDLVSDAGGTVSPASGRYIWTRYLPCTAYEHEHPVYCTEPARDRTALHRGDDALHFCLAPTTSTPKPCPVRSPGVLRITREIARTIAAHRT